MQHVKPPTNVIRAKGKVICVRGHDGSLLTPGSLPLPGIRWVPRQKAVVVAAVRGGLITLEEACKRYELTRQEFDGWQRAIDRSGVRGLRMPPAKHHRKPKTALTDPIKDDP